MGVVYLARQEGLNRVVALKMILHGGHAGAEERARFLAEAEAIARARHPGIVQVHGFGTHDGLPWFSLEYCENGSLAARLEAEGPLPPREAAEVVERVARAMQAAHDAGIVHRDLKPANILLAADGSPRVTDFGVSKNIGSEGPTRTGAVLGTPSYMSPEQAEGKKEVGPSADVWALGAVLYACLTGRPPFQAATPLDTIMQVVSDDPIPPRKLNSAVPSDLETICLKCLRKQPEGRYSSAAAVADDLKRWLDGRPIAARPVSRLEKALSWCRREPVTASLIGALALLILAGGTLVTWQWRIAVEALGQARAEQRQRLLAQIEALQSVAPEAVPSILASLATSGPEATRALESAQEQEVHPARRARLSLALLASNPEKHRATLAELMLKSEDPAEVLLFRDALAPHAEGLAGDLWGRDDLPALAALAAFDPENTRWRSVARQAVAELLSSNPLHLGAWSKGLKPARRHLLEPLAAAFRQKDVPGPRLLAARVLADYASDQPGLLIDLLLDADPAQYAVLRAALAPHRSEVVTRLKAELASSGRSVASPPSSYPEPSKEVLAELERHDGMASPHFALCPSIPMNRIGAVSEALGACGYRPARIRPHGAAAAVVWHRDGRKWKVTFAQTAGQVGGARQAGLALADVGPYLGEKGELLHCITWVAPRVGERSYAFAGQSTAQVTAQVAAAEKKGALPCSIQGILLPGGEVAYCGVFRQLPDQPREPGITLGEHLRTIQDRCFGGLHVLEDVGAHEADAIRLPIPTRTTAGVGGMAWKAALRSDGQGWVKVEEELTNTNFVPRHLEVARARILAARIEAARQLGLALAGLPLDANRVEAHLAEAESLLVGAEHRGAPDADTWAQDPDFSALAGRRRFARLTAPRPPEDGLRYSAAWAYRREIESCGVQGLAPRDHLGRSKELAAQGWWPVGISVARGLVSSAWQRPSPTEGVAEAHRRQAVAAITLLQLGEADVAWNALEGSHGPDLLSHFSALAGPLGVKVEMIIEGLERRARPDLRRCLILALGELPAKDLPDRHRERLSKLLLAWFQDEPDPGVHGAIQWLFGHSTEGTAPRPYDWGLRGRLEAMTRNMARPDTAMLDRGWGWFVNSRGQTYVAVRGPVELRMGSPPWEQGRRSEKEERPHRRIIPHSFAIAANLVTLREWEEFRREVPGAWPGDAGRPGQEPDCPARGMSMYDAMKYCNWLSRKEGIPRAQWCYPERIEEGMKLPADILKRTGYRLPMEAEWEYACRAGTMTSRSCGEGEDLLKRYAWYRDSSSDRAWPVGMKRPNRLGLFDMHGNVWQWCHDPGYYWNDFPRRTTHIYLLKIDEEVNRIVRGGAFDTWAQDVRSAVRNNFAPNNHGSTTGFRPCRTIP